MKWELASVEPGAFASVPPRGAVSWEPVTLPVRGGDDLDHWFRTSLDVRTETHLWFGGLASVCDVYLDGEHVVRSESMFLEHRLPVAPGVHELAICARALTPLLAEPRRPRARWRTRVPTDGNLRWVRTTLLGRAPGFAPGPPLVGPWRGVELEDPDALRFEVRTSVDGEDGLVHVRCGKDGPLEAAVGSVRTRLPPGGGTLRVPNATRWWPHTHGTPALHDLRVRAGDAEGHRRIGFRERDCVGDLERHGLALVLNGVPVFARGAVWVPPPPGERRATLERARDAGLNLIRVVGTTVYEDDEFYSVCDELGLLVWQDLMFANMDYPFADEGFRELAVREVRQALSCAASHPSLVVVCGNSEVEQQVGMLGLPSELGRDGFYETTAPALMETLSVDAAYVRSAPTGGAFPFRTDRGVANYFGVGAYLQPLADVRRARVLFASECLAFANVPDDGPRDRAQGVMRDVGAAWDFADVRDHYLRSLHGVGPGDDDYWERSRHVTGELMSAVFGEWRRGASNSSGGIVLWLRDLVAGSGWGLLDHAGRPKLAWHHLRRALAPVAVWLVDEGLNGVSIHVANDTPDRLVATLRLTLYRDGTLAVDTVEQELRLEPHSVVEFDAEVVLGRFVDVGYAYRFGEPQHHAVVASLEQQDRLLSQAFFYPVESPLVRKTQNELGLSVEARPSTGSSVVVRLSSTTIVRGVRLHAHGLEPVENGFDLEPGRHRVTTLRHETPGAEATGLRITALNLSGQVDVAIS